MIGERKIIQTTRTAGPTVIQISMTSRNLHRPFEDAVGFCHPVKQTAFVITYRVLLDILSSKIMCNSPTKKEIPHEAFRGRKIHCEMSVDFTVKWLATGWAVQGQLVEPAVCTIVTYMTSDYKVRSDTRPNHWIMKYRSQWPANSMRSFYGDWTSIQRIMPSYLILSDTETWNIGHSDLHKTWGHSQCDTEQVPTVWCLCIRKCQRYKIK